MALKYLSFIFVIFGLISCQSDILEIEEPENLDYLYLSDSCSYTIHNKTYSCDNRLSHSSVFAPVNPDPETAVGYKDSLLFASTFSLVKFHVDNMMVEGKLDLSFGKKFTKKDLDSEAFFTRINSKDYLDIFKIGNYPYAVDYLRTNTQNGVAIAVEMINVDGSRDTYRTYIFSPNGTESSIPLDAQKDSYFEITKVHHLSGDRRIVEAEFSATVFLSTTYTPWLSTYEQAARLEKGYIRFSL